MTLTTATFVLFVLIHFEPIQNAEILVEPTTQYTMIGENATFTCNTIGREAHWVLNGIPMTISYENEKQVYEDRGVTFLEDAYQQYFNLTMIIHASLALNNTMIFCSVIDADFTVKMSQEVHLIISNMSRIGTGVTESHHEESSISETTMSSKESDANRSRDVIALGTSLALVTLMLVTVSILFMLFGVYHYRISKPEIKLYKLNNDKN